ncbi:MAG: hypothetical protein WCB79_06310 [Halobacteriota archaeon]
MGDIVQWDQSNRAYITTHSVSGIDWKHYKRLLPEHVFDVYMKYWRDTRFAISQAAGRRHPVFMHRNFGVGNKGTAIGP